MERMKRFEPSTFCMARSPRSAPRTASNRHGVLYSRTLIGADDTK